MLSLSDLGWTADHSSALKDHRSSTLEPTRVVGVERTHIQTMGSRGPESLQVSGRFSRIQEDPLNRPTVGDWALIKRIGEDAIIEDILPRTSVFVRRAVGRAGRPQTVAANIDKVLVVTAVGTDFSPRRLERYLAAVWDGGAQPIIVVNKTDLVSNWDELIRAVNGVSMGCPIAFVSAVETDGLEELRPHLTKGETIALLGSSGVGKSTLTNWIVGRDIQPTQSISLTDDKGQHTTTSRSLLIAPSGCLVIDTPGMRELGLWQAEGGVDLAFADVLQLAQQCRYRDCLHDSEPGCQIQEAIESSELDPNRLRNFQKLKRELAYDAKRGDKKAQSNAKKRWKTIQVAYKNRDKLRRNNGRK